MGCTVDCMNPRQIPAFAAGALLAGTLAFAVTSSGALGATSGTSSPQILFATVQSDGTLSKAQSQGATGVEHTAQGKYKITFNRSLSRCSASAASLAGDQTGSVFGWNNQIMLSLSGSSVYATLQGMYDGPADYAFSVILACKPLPTADLSPPKVVAPPKGAGGTSTSTTNLLFATVQSNGALTKSRSEGAVSVEHTAQGKYKITFNRSLSRCSASAASLAGDQTGSVFGWNNQIMLSLSGSSVYATLQGMYDGPADYAFSVILTCNDLLTTRPGPSRPITPRTNSG